METIQSDVARLERGPCHVASSRGPPGQHSEYQGQMASLCIKPLRMPHVILLSDNDFLERLGLYSQGPSCPISGL